MTGIAPEDQIGSIVQQLQTEVFELNKLFELNRIITYATDVAIVAEKLVNFIKDELNSKNIFFFINEDDSYRVLSFKSADSSGNFEFKNSGEGIWQIFEEGQPFCVLDEEGNNIYSQFFVNHKLDSIKTSYFIPFTYEGEILAVLSIGEKVDGTPYSNDDIRLFQKIAQFFAPALNKYKQEEIKEKHSTKLQKTLHNISILYNIGLAINFIDDLKKLLKVILENAIRTIGAEKGSLMLYDSMAQDLVVKVVHGLPDKDVEDKINDGLFECTRIKVGEGIAGEAFITKKPIIANLGSFDPKFKHSSASNVASILCIPLIFKNECIGVINITNKLNEKLFNQDDMEFMIALSNQASMAINNAQLYELAIKDGLTKLYIYRHFHYLLDSELKRSERYGHPVTLLMMDIDNFKSINDTYGHQIGDEILKQIAEVIQKTCRKIDMPSRYGGEEFSMILPETTATNAKIIAERLRQRIENIKVKTKNNNLLSPTISIGIAAFPEHAANSDELIGFADKALYYAKGSGKNCVAMFDKQECVVVSCSVNWKQNSNK